MYTQLIMSDVSSQAVVKNARVYLVGGFLRDLYLGRPGRDLDFAVSGDAMDFARAVSVTLKGAYIPLDRFNGVARVVLEYGGERWQVDFATLKGSNVEEDLARRDFTINAMAMELPAYYRLTGAEGDPLEARSRRQLWYDEAIDPFGALADLEARVIRAVNKYVFEADPLRILRAVRLAGKLNFKIKPATVELMEKNRWLLYEVAGERVWEELLGVLSLQESYSWVALMDETGILSELFPFIDKLKVSDTNYKEFASIWEHTLKAYGLVEELCRNPAGSFGIPDNSRTKELSQLIVNHLACTLSSGHRRFQLLKLASLLHDAGKVETARQTPSGRLTFTDHHMAGLKYVKEAGRRLRLSRAEEAYLDKLVSRHLYPLQLYAAQPPGPEETYRFFNSLGLEVTDVLLLSIADVAATCITNGNAGELTNYRWFCRDLLFKYYFEAETYVKPPSLVDGKGLMEALDLPPSKKIGELLSQIAWAQVRGEVGSKEEAIAYAGRLLAKAAEPGKP